MTFFSTSNILHECGTDGEAGQWLMKVLLLNVAEAFVPIIAASELLVVENKWIQDSCGF